MGANGPSGKLVVLKDGGTRRFRSKEERRAIVEATLKPGASIATVMWGGFTSTSSLPF